MGKTTKKSDQTGTVEVTSSDDNMSTNSDTPATPKVVDLSKENVQQAISLGKEMTGNGESTKADVARKMYELIKDESREVIVAAFIEGASLTPAGAQTYYYNVKRKSGKA